MPTPIKYGDHVEHEGEWVSITRSLHYMYISYNRNYDTGSAETPSDSIYVIYTVLGVVEISFYPHLVSVHKPRTYVVT